MADGGESSCTLLGALVGDSMADVLLFVSSFEGSTVGRFSSGDSIPDVGESSDTFVGTLTED